MKNFQFQMAAILLCGLTACSKPAEQESAAQLVRLTTVESTKEIRQTVYPAKTKASETVSMAFRVSGTIDKVPVKAGDYVRKGQLVAAMDDRDYKVQLAATEAEYHQVKAEAERIIALYNDHGTSANNYDKARYGLEQITAKYDNHKNQLADTRLYAPFNGYVQSVLFEGHETVSAGMPVLTLFCADGMELVVNIPAAEFQMRDMFDTFVCSFDVLPGQTFPLKLLNINQKANANQLYEVRLLLEGDHKQVTPGMTSMVTLSYKADSNVPMSVSAKAVFDNGNGPQVFVYDGTGAIHLRNVVVGALHTDGTAEITSGLKAGERVVASGVHHLKDGQSVTPEAEPAKTNVGGLL